jgi:hypothetical protein
MEVLSDQLSRKRVFHSLRSHCWLLCERTELGQLDAERTFYLLSFFCAHIWERVGESEGLSKVLLLFLKEILEKEIWKDVMLDFCQFMNKSNGNFRSNYVESSQT